jgi:hypothetical protein
MLDFSPYHKGAISIQQLADGLSVADLHRLSDEMVDTILAILQDVGDAEVTFQPLDPQANDPYAADNVDVNLAWTLGHVVVHTTASSEESAALACQLARGIPVAGRSRYETPWQAVTTIAQLRQRLEESRSMRHAFLRAWPEQPHLELTYIPWPTAGSINALGRFLLGLTHEDDHLVQMREIIRQAGIVA